jgi:hypothetical protein
MKEKGTKKIAVADLRTNLFVRKALDEDHAFHLGELIEAGVEMTDLIEVVQKEGAFEIVDGRHRREGYEIAKVREVKVKILEFESEAEMIAYAYRKNTGGAKPPTAADTEHTVMLLLQRNESMKSIGEMLGLPASIARRYANEVKSKMNRAKLQKAATAVTGGLTINQAAEEHGVALESLREILSGRVRKHKKGGVQDFKRTVSSAYRSMRMKYDWVVKKSLEKFEDGDINEKQVRATFGHIEELQESLARSTADSKKRFEAVLAVQQKQAEKMAKSA